MEENRSARDRELDETLEETFPASDAPANTVETGIGIGPLSVSPVVIDNREASQFELVVEGQTAVLRYERTPTSLVLVHTEVPPSLRGRHLADALARAAIDAARAEGVPVVVCVVQAPAETQPCRTWRCETSVRGRDRMRLGRQRQSLMLVITRSRMGHAVHDDRKPRIPRARSGAGRAQWSIVLKKREGYPAPSASSIGKVARHAETIRAITDPSIIETG